MGSGKSHVGKELAERLKWRFVDMDDYLEAATGKTINDIFEEDGADEFRRLERKYLHDSVQWTDAVIATGGGAPCFFDNIKWMNSRGLTIYLRTPVEVLQHRLNAATAHRPLLQGKTEIQVKNFIIETMNVRAFFYEQASVIYDVRISHQPVAQELHDALAQIVGH